MIKKQLIMEKALELFAEKGIEATSVQQITDLCGISKGAFYLSFKSKDELILALIDHFMMQISSDIDHIVKNTKNDEELLYNFYYSTFNSFHKRSDFAKVMMKEQAQSFNEELFFKIRHYDKLIEESILEMVDRLYGEKISPIRYDLTFCIKGFFNNYSHLFLFYNVPLDLEQLCQSLVEKTNILAEHSSIPFITHDLSQMFKDPFHEEVTQEQVLEVMEQKVKELEDSIEKESLELLKQDVLEPALSRAIIKGLIENLQNHPHCKWIGFLLRKYYAF